MSMWGDGWGGAVKKSGEVLWVGGFIEYITHIMFYMNV